MEELLEKELDHSELFEKTKRGKSQTAIPNLKEYKLIIENDGLYGARIFSLIDKANVLLSIFSRLKRY